MNEWILELMKGWVNEEWINEWATWMNELMNVNPGVWRNKGCPGTIGFKRMYSTLY